MLRTAILTSEVHYVPNNYGDFFAHLLERKHHFEVVSIIELGNGGLPLMLKALTVALVAPRLGLQLIKNGWDSRHRRLERFCQQHDIQYLRLKKINTQSFRQYLSEQKIDLLVNARTRAIFGPKLLKTPRLGCINVHHGLLPLQRGTFCDFHALRRGENPGFTIHEMTAILDDGAILAQQSLPYQSNYLQYIQASAAVEGETLAQLLDTVAQIQRLPNALMPNSGDATYYQTPSLPQLIMLKRNGVKI